MDDLQARLRRALEAFPEVLAGWVFGSRGRGDARAGADLDVAVLERADLPAKPAAWRRAARYAMAIEAEVRAPTDVVLMRAAPLQLAERVLREGRLVLDRAPELRADFEARQLSRYLDDLPMQRAYDRAFAEGARRRMP